MICDKIITDRNCNTIVLNEEFDPDYVYIYIMLLNKYNGNTFSQTFVRTKADDKIIFTIGLDGFYTLCKIKVSKDPSKLYYYEDGNFYKNIKEISIEELVEVNPEESDIERTYYYYFLLCKLRACYVNAAKKVLYDDVSIRCETRVDKFDTYKRDLLWSALNVISYLAEFDLFEEAERLLERITSCNGLCDDNNICGCKCGH